MNGILVINKEKNYTSRDVVNIVGKYLGTKKVGHIGTLDPLATGVLVLCVGSALKMVKLLVNHNKEYIATFKLGIETDTLDITGNIIKHDEKIISEKDLQVCLNSFVGKIMQEVPIYSAVKVNGKKLYEYARNNEKVVLPVREVNIYDISLLSYNINTKEVVISCTVSKGTYIRSLVRDIGKSLNTCATLVALNRTKLGNFNINESFTLDDIKNNNFNLIDIKELYPIQKKIIVEDELLFKIKNGMVLKRFFDGEDAMILDKNENLIAIYKTCDDKTMVKPWKMFIK